MKRVLLPLIFCCLLTACGGGNGSSLNSGPTPNQSLAGIWTGTATSTSSPGAASVLGVVTEQNDAFFHTEHGNFHGKLSASADKVAGILHMQVDTGEASVTVTGSIREKQSLSLSYLVNGTDHGTFSLTYDPVYAQPSSLDAVSGHWDAFNPIARFLVASDGTIHSETPECLTTGEVSLPNPSFNIYKVNVSVRDCVFYQGTFDGLAILTNTHGFNDTLTLFLDDGVHLATVKSERL